MAELEPVDIQFRVNDDEFAAEIDANINRILAMGKAGEATADKSIEVQRKVNEETRKTVESMEAMEQAQAELLKLFAAGEMSTDEYAEAQKRLEVIFSESGKESKDFLESLKEFPGVSGNVRKGIDGISTAKKLWSSAIAIVNTRLGMSITLSKVFLATGIGALIAGIALLVIELKKWADEQSRINEQERKLSEAIGENSQTVAKAIVDFARYRKILEDSASTVKEKEDVVKELNKTYGDTFGKLNNIDEAETAIKNKAGAYIEMLHAKARAQAAYNLMLDSQTEAVKKSALSARELAKEDLPSWLPGFAKDLIVDRYTAEELESRREGRLTWIEMQARKESDAYLDIMQEAQGKADEIASENSFNIFKEYTYEWWKEKQTEASERLRAMEDYKKGTDDWIKAQKEYETATKALDSWNFNPKKGRNYSDSAANARLQLTKQEIDNQNKADALLLAAMEEGAGKRLKQAEIAYKNELDAVEKQRLELSKLEGKARKDGKFSEADASRIAGIGAALDEQEKAASVKYEASVKKINEESEKALKLIWDDVNRNFRTGLENNLAEIERYYDEQIKKAKEAGATVKDIEELNNRRGSEKEIAGANDALERLKFEEELNTRRQQMANTTYLFEADKQKALYLLSKEYIEKRLKLLKQLQAAGVKGLDEEIALLEQGMAELNKLLNETEYDKLREGAQYLGELGNLIGKFDEDLGNLISLFGELGEAAVTLTEGIISGNPQQIIQGALGAASSIADIINLNKKANEEIKEFERNLANMATVYSIALINAMKDVKGINDSIFNTDATNALVQGMNGYNKAIAEQTELMSQLGDVTVKTGTEKKKFLFITYGTKDVYENLLKTYPDLIQKDGELNRELADTLLQSGNLSKKAQDLVTNIISAADAAEAAMEQVNSTISNLSGTIGDDLRDSLVDAFKNGTDAAVDFGEKVEKILENIISQMLFSAIFGEQLKELEKRMKDSFNGGDGDLADDIIWFYKNLDKGIEEFNKGLETAKELGKENGLNLFTPEEESQQAAQTGAFKAVSQDSFDLWLGQFTAIRIHTANISDALIRDNGLMIARLARIEENTKVSADNLVLLYALVRRWDTEGMRIS